VNAAIRDELKGEHRLGAQDVTVASLTPLSLTRAEAREAASYKAGDVVISVRSVEGLERDKLYRVTSTLVNLVSRRAAARSARPALSVRPREDSQLSGRRLGVLSDHARLRHNRLGEKGGAPAAPGREGIMAPVTSACGRN
jgi:hypothetical protein